MSRVSFIDMAGQRYGKLTVLHKVESDRRGEARWSCECECGTRVNVRGSCLRKGQRSCGCDRGTHGEHTRTRRTKEYNSWAAMRQRCLNKHRMKYASYGGRGISVCERWNDYRNFLADMGRAPSPAHSIDRINNDGNYEPSNCRWATTKEQAQNQRRRYQQAA